MPDTELVTFEREPTIHVIELVLDQNLLVEKVSAILQKNANHNDDGSSSGPKKDTLL